MNILNHSAPTMIGIDHGYGNIKTAKRTIKQKVVVTSVDTASEALAVSLAEKAKVDMPYMMELTGKTEQEIYTDLTGVIFLNPMGVPFLIRRKATVRSSSIPVITSSLWGKLSSPFGIKSYSRPNFISAKKRQKTAKR